MKEGKARSRIHLIEVIPINKTPGRNTLSYFSLDSFKIGQIVKIPLRQSEVPAVVVGVRTAESAKVGIKNATYALRKISKKNVLDAHLSLSLMRTAEAMAVYYGSSIGTILKAAVPKFVLDEPELFGKPKAREVRSDLPSKEPLVIQMDKEERLGQYRSVIRQSFARQESVMVIVPSIEEAKCIFESLSRGINEFAYLLTSDTKKKERREVWLKAGTHKHSILLVTTPLGLVFDRKDLGTYILERENSQAYKSFERPFINIKTLLLRLAKESGRELILGDSVLSIETLWRERDGQYGEVSPVKWRLATAPTKLIDMKPPKKKGESGSKRQFTILSPELITTIKKALAEKENFFLFGVRKGLAPTTVCGDCGATLPCPACGAPIILYTRSEENLYVCHRCGHKRSAKTLCDNCGSWKLTPLGIGTDLIYKEVRKLFPLARVAILDKNHATTPVRAKKIAEEFKNQGGILVGTELALFHLEKVAYTGLVSADPLFSIPDFGAEERVFYLVSRLREMSQKGCIVQTRNIGKEILTWAIQGNILDFYKREIEDRQVYLYPPFSLFIKISGRGIGAIKECLAEWKPEQVKDSLIIRLPRESWPDGKLVETLSLLPQSFLIKVDPESLI
ncbi:MAG: hypothetical protein ABIF06_01920 [bacterium]